MSEILVFGDQKKMKLKTAFAPAAALSIALFSAPASAVLIDFIDLTEGPAGPGNLGESAWDVLSLPGAFGLEITGHTRAVRTALAHSW